MQIFPSTSDGLPYSATNRVLGGYSQYCTSKADNIAAGTYGDGASLSFDSANLIKYFQLNHHWFVVGAEAVFEDCSRLDLMNAEMVAPATEGLTEMEGGDFELAGGVLIVPVAEGTGTHDLDLDATWGGHGHVLKCVPVPAAGNNGFFDYDKWANYITPNLDQKGGYNLYNIDVSLHRFANELFGRAGNGSSKKCESADVVGKLIYNFWKLKFQAAFNTAGSPWMGIEMQVFVKKNL